MSELIKQHALLSVSVSAGLLELTNLASSSALFINTLLLLLLLRLIRICRRPVDITVNKKEQQWFPFLWITLKCCQV